MGFLDKLFGRKKKKEEAAVGQTAAAEPETEETEPLPEPAREVAPEPEESIETNIGDEVSAALAEQEQQKEEN